jgi:hypothetical protein
MIKLCARLVAMVFSLMLPAIAVVHAQQKPVKPAASDLDDALLRDLDNELLEGAGDLKTPAKPAAGKPGKPSAGDQTSPPAIDGEDVGMPGENDDPLVHISQEMRSLEELIPRSGKRPHAEAIQNRVLDDLSRLIEQAESQRNQQQSSSQKKQEQQKQVAERKKQQQPEKQEQQSGGARGKDSSKPAQDSTDRLGQAKEVRPDAEALRGMMKDSWGHLPPRAREQMLQNTPEQFLPQYELMIEKYYKRLAEERPTK